MVEDTAANRCPNHETVCADGGAVRMSMCRYPSKLHGDAQPCMTLNHASEDTTACTARNLARVMRPDHEKGWQSDPHILANLRQYSDVRSPTPPDIDS